MKFFSPVLDRKAAAGGEPAGSGAERNDITLVGPDESGYESALSSRGRVVHYALLAAWAVSLFTFWRWWAQPAHQVSPARTALVLFLLSYITVVMPLLPVVFLARVRRVKPGRPIPFGRVAIAITKAPSEPWPLVRQTLEAMLLQDFPRPYDTWLCDEDPTSETVTWCQENQVRLSTRKGVAEYHQPSWPRRTKCKEGNLAYFYDHWGYEEYDFVAQLDADHVPTTNYLAEMIRPFDSPGVGYVAAPSICDSNAASSWAARGRLYKEASLHGPSQAGCNEGFAPVCIGSHYAVRTSALEEIGGLGPELAEDFTTSLLLNAAGWQGAFAIDAEAHGEGPPTFSALLVQEFQWSRSLTNVLLDLFPKQMSSLPWRLRVRFLLALAYYPMLAITTVTAVAMVPIAAVTGTPWMRVNYFEFLVRWSLISAPLLVATYLMRRRRLLRPVDAKLLSWEVWLFCFTRWPYVAWGVLSAIRERLRPVQTTFRVTPKGEHGLDPLPVRLIVPYLAIVIGVSAAGLARSQRSSVHGYVLLSLLAGATYLLVSLAVILLHAHESRRHIRTSWGQVVAGVHRPIMAFLPALLFFGASVTSVFHL